MRNFFHNKVGVNLLEGAAELRGKHLSPHSMLSDYTQEILGICTVVQHEHLQYGSKGKVQLYNMYIYSMVVKVRYNCTLYIIVHLQYASMYNCTLHNMYIYGMVVQYVQLVW